MEQHQDEMLELHEQEEAAAAEAATAAQKAGHAAAMEQANLDGESHLGAVYHTVSCCQGTLRRCS